MLDRRAFLGASAVAAAGVACARAARTPAARDVSLDDPATRLRIGALYPVTGPVGPYGREELNGVEAAVDLVNEDGGIGGAMNGRGVDLVVRDVPDLDAGWEQAYDLVHSERLPLLLGTYSSVIALATTQAAADLPGVVYWENGAVADLVITRRVGETYRTGPSSALLAGQGIEFLATQVAPAHGLTAADLRLGLIYENGPYGGAVGQRAATIAGEHGIEVVADIPYDARGEDFVAPMQVLEQARPNVVLAATYLDDGVRFATAIRDANLDLLGLVGKCAAFFTREFAAMLDGKAEGLFLSDKPMRVDREALTPAARATADRFEAHYLARYGEEPTDGSYTGFAGTWLLLTEVLPRLERVEADAFRRAVADIDLPLGALPNGAGARFAGGEHPFRGQNLRALGVIWQWQGERPALVHPARFATATPDFGSARVGTPRA